MGCDIHVHIEIKVKGKWLHYNHPKIRRNYRLFAKMSGVRAEEDGGEAPIATPRGVPADATETTRFDYEVRWGRDAHSASWLSSKELVALEEWADEEKVIPGAGVCDFAAAFGWLFGNSFAGIEKYPEDWRPYRAAGFDDVRAIFWFGN